VFSQASRFSTIVPNARTHPRGLDILWFVKVSCTIEREERSMRRKTMGGICSQDGTGRDVNYFAEVVGRRLGRRQDFLHLLSHCPYAYEARDELYLRHNRISYIYLLNGASVLLFLFSNNKYILYPCTCWFQEITEFLFSQQVTAFNETWSENNGMRRDHRNHNNTYTPISKRHKAHNGTRLRSWLVTRTEICAWKNIVGKMIRLYRARNIVVSVEAKRFALEILLSRNYNDDCKRLLKKKVFRFHFKS